MSHEFFRSLAEEVVEREWLYCRLIGGPSAGDVVEVKSDCDVFYVPIRSCPPILDLKLKEPLKPAFTQATYVRLGFLSTQFYFVDE